MCQESLLGGRGVLQAPGGEAGGWCWLHRTSLGVLQPTVQLGVQAAASSRLQLAQLVNFQLSFSFSDILGSSVLNPDHKEPYLLVYEIMIK